MIRIALIVGSMVVLCAPYAHADPPPLSDAVVARVQEIHAHNPDLRDDAFAKMGGSSVASKAFLHCFATPHVDLGEHDELAPTLDYFNTGRHSSFNRESEAAGVSWNLKYVLGGRPANFRQEIGTTQARWALILFGGNDAQNENERIYLKRLVYLIEQLEDVGVVPIVGSALPRRSRSKDRWIQRFNAITEAVARHWALPFIDYHGALSTLPRKGLAGDGVHPNVLPPGGLGTACVLTKKGLRYGNNVRNLLTLQMLDALRKTVATEQTPPGRPVTDANTVPPTIPAPIPAPATPLPLSTIVHPSSLPPASTLPARCGRPEKGARVYRARIVLSEPARLRASALSLDGERPRLFWVRIDEDGSERCVRRRNQTLEVDVPAGMWDLIVEVSGRTEEEERMLVLIAPDPR